jgi:hypothetical protein
MGINAESHAPSSFTPVKNLKKTVGLGMVSLTALFGRYAEAQETSPPAPSPAASDTMTNNPSRLMQIFNNSEVTGTGWALPLAKLDASGSLTLRTELGYADPIPGLYVNDKFAPGAGEVDAGFMNFSQNIFPLGDTLNFNSKGDRYSNGEQTGKQLGLRYRNTFTFDNSSSLNYNAFVGYPAFGGGPSTGVNADMHEKLGEWNLLQTASIAWLGERNVLALNSMAAASRTFSYTHLPDGKFTTGIELREEFGRKGESKATAFVEYQSHLVKQDEGPHWLRPFSALFGAYAGTQSHGGKVGLLYTPHGIGGENKDFGVSFGPSVGWDSRQGGPQYNFELRMGF